MKAAILDPIFASELLDTREKWLIVRQIKKGRLTNEQIEGILKLLQKEVDFVRQAGHHLDQNYLQALKAWHLEVDRLYHQQVVQKKHVASEFQHEEDSQAADDLLNDL